MILVTSAADVRKYALSLRLQFADDDKAVLRQMCGISTELNACRICLLRLITQGEHNVRTRQAAYKHAAGDLFACAYGKM